MFVAVFLFSGLTDYATQTLSTIHVDYLVIVSATSNIVCLSILSSIPSMSISRTVFLLCPATIFYSNKSEFILKCWTHPNKINRLVFYFLFLSRRLIETPLSTQPLLAHCCQRSTPFRAPANNRGMCSSPLYYNVAVPSL